MNKVEVEPSVFTFTSAVSAAGNLAEVKQGKLIQAMIFKRGFDSEIEISNALITMYAKCGSISDSKRKIHAFFVGDKLHPLADEIYEYLEELNNRAADIGYVQDHNSLLNETEMEQKDPTLYVHSEKLAVTFALLSLPDGIPIRVMKNLRVCSDCHNWIKFISRISNREIVVRDAYRFHHFENGNCSCKDFW
ncbi:unnamed protein product [Linum tenue]|uniref:DYW domain-containing protein n=1 Tax=Linum tenue TaxID=586396 RepID=A0AAV0HH83_9ROSI|nr:unnamed protein product [Linum tenue]